MSVVPIIRPFEAAEQTSAAPHAIAGFYGFVLRMAAAAVREVRVRRDTQRLAEFDDYMLRDIGITRTDIEGVVRRGRDDWNCQA